MYARVSTAKGHRSGNTILEVDLGQSLPLIPSWRSLEWLRETIRVRGACVMHEMPEMRIATLSDLVRMSSARYIPRLVRYRCAVPNKL